ncbi:MAG: ferritin family protein, partial [Phycisphaerae bacterium]|nr:ferritin family protein [Phycisphaerae bacterium]
ESVDEILDFAIGREIEAIRLYIDLAGKVNKPEMREVLKGFAREEQEHKIKLEDAKAVGMVLVDEEVASLGIADEVEGGEFHPDMSYAEILLFAIKKEDVSVKLYTDMAKIAQDEEVKDMLLQLAQEETEHKLRFEMEYDLTTF